MRQVGTLSTPRDAQRFAAWLTAHEMQAHAEEEHGGWVVWVRDEDHLARAREALAHYLAHPQDPRYQGAEQAAQARLREHEERVRAAAAKVVEMRGRWGSGPGAAGVSRRAPLIFALMAAAILAAIVTADDTMRESAADQPPGAIYRNLVFVDPLLALQIRAPVDMWASLRRGELWRLITPIFVHYGPVHLLLNLMWLYSFGSQIEDRRGARFVLLLVLSLAVISNVGQALEASFRGQWQFFGGLSGVGYGLLGYLLVKIRFDPRESYFLSPGTTFIAFLWLAVCLARDLPGLAPLLADAIPPIANTAHVVGLVLGGAIAYLPLLVRRGE
jgi:GlpG protein